MEQPISVSAKPRSFWIGAGLVAEAILVIVIALMPGPIQREVTDRLSSEPIFLVTAVLVLLAVYFLIAWIAHRLGLG